MMSLKVSPFNEGTGLILETKPAIYYYFKNNRGIITGEKTTQMRI